VETSEGEVSKGRKTQVSSRRLLPVYYGVCSAEI